VASQVFEQAEFQHYGSQKAAIALCLRNSHLTDIEAKVAGLAT
jgi:hypothetical protein